MTVYLWGLLRGYAEANKIYKYTNDHLGEWFPKLLSYSVYITRLNKLCPVFQAWLEHLRDDFHVLKRLMNITLIDSMPVVMAKGSRKYKASRLSERKRSRQTRPEHAEAPYHELHDMELYGDKAYCDSWIEFLFQQRDAKLSAPVKRKKGGPFLTLFKRVFTSMVSRVRQPIEPFFNWIERKTGLQNASAGSLFQRFVDSHFWAARRRFYTVTD